MAKAKKLPSGQWRTLVYSHTDSSGKRHYESFTAATKKESEFQAAEFALNKNKKKKESHDMLLKDAMNSFIADRSQVLSPSTIREYCRMSGKNFGTIEEIRLSKLDSLILQKWVNNLSASGKSPKTVKNSYGFLSAVLNAYLPGKTFQVRLPSAVHYEASVPTDADVAALIAWHKDHDPDMYIASCLAAFGTLRRSEICPLDAEDVRGNCVLIRKAMVQNAENEWVIKQTNKTQSSNRVVPLPPAFIRELPTSGRLVSLHPGLITRRHERAIQKLGIPSFRFHDLRHYTASIMHAIGIPDQYIMALGGWASDKVLKSVYRGTVNDYMDMYTGQAVEHFNQVFDQASSGLDSAF